MKGAALWLGVLLAFGGAWLGLRNHKVALGEGELIVCGSAWFPVDGAVGRLYPRVAQVCEQALGSWGTVATVALLVGIGVALGAIAAVAMGPPLGTPDHP